MLLFTVKLPSYFCYIFLSYAYDYGNHCNCKIDVLIAEYRNNDSYIHSGIIEEMFSSTGPSTPCIMIGISWSLNTSMITSHYDV